MTTSLIARGIDRATFLRLFNNLCVALRDPGDDSGVTQGVYFEALQDLPQAALEAGAQALMQERGRRFFPTTAEWRDAAITAQGRLLREALPHRGEPWKVECETCRDTGWVMDLSCDGGADEWPEAKPASDTIGHKRPWRYRAEARKTATPQPPVCGRDRPHAPHSYTKACLCRATNRTYQRHQQFGKGE